MEDMNRYVKALIGLKKIIYDRTSAKVVLLMIILVAYHVVIFSFRFYIDPSQ